MIQLTTNREKSDVSEKDRSPALGTFHTARQGLG